MFIIKVYFTWKCLHNKKQNKNNTQVEIMKWCKQAGKVDRRATTGWSGYHVDQLQRVFRNLRVAPPTGNSSPQYVRPGLVSVYVWEFPMCYVHSSGVLNSPARPVMKQQQAAVQKNKGKKLCLRISCKHLKVWVSALSSCFLAAVRWGWQWRWHAGNWRMQEMERVLKSQPKNVDNGTWRERSVSRQCSAEGDIQARRCTETR